MGTLKTGTLTLKFDENKLKDALKHLQNANKGLKVGILHGATNADKDGVSVAEYAYFNEFGTKNIPARPFFRNAISDNENLWAEALRRQLTGIAGGSAETVSQALKIAGHLMRSSVQQSISKGGFAPLSPITIKRKGKTTPLIDTRDMFNAISYEVVSTQ